MIEKVDNIWYASARLRGIDDVVHLGQWQLPTDATCAVKAARYLVEGGERPPIPDSFMRFAERRLSEHTAKHGDPVAPVRTTAKGQRILTLLSEGRDLHRVRIILGVDLDDIVNELGLAPSELFKQLTELEVEPLAVKQLTTAAARRQHETRDAA